MYMKTFQKNMWQPNINAKMFYVRNGNLSKKYIKQNKKWNISNILLESTREN